MQTNLLNKWNKIIKISKIEKLEETDKWWNVINQRYNEKQRYYHNLAHINELLNLEEQFNSKLKKSEVVQWSIWFHDIIYDPTKSDNEEQSAKLFHDFSKDVRLPDQVTLDVSRYILATANHTKVKSDAESDKDLLYFLDMDLSILGTDESIYKTYSDAIKKEYSHIEDDKYRVGRSKILQSFVDAGYESLFKTNEFKEIYGQKAIENLKNEIKQLQS
ncbi:hypothetical protein RB653_009096 [Dictyostelium firmibasis]|uniref:HD domain-containing protein n=1 Tax=Dictyostelium firmibasis TaxID=79012 RepID=A0AAN7U171_9MYCE